ncbi:hypothetical protein D9C73_009301 [Collichthys lucidus]|uniref:Uncharacterized protein n=1 Tax=Collichthys lucidus TaxID=240159 RepID=A0A4U5UK71_COLLU|nr:hypothetical protein D9C73_009301 [Collichthys lucidus]
MKESEWRRRLGKNLQRNSQKEKEEEVEAEEVEAEEVEAEEVEQVEGCCCCCCCCYWCGAFRVMRTVQMIPAAAAEIVCNVTRLRDDLYKYQLSSPSQCKMGWEDVNKTAYAHEFVFDPDRVDNVTRDYIVLKSCQDYMHFTDDCLKHDAVEEVHCRGESCMTSN